VSLLRLARRDGHINYTGRSEVVSAGRDVRDNVIVFGSRIIILEGAQLENFQNKLDEVSTRVFTEKAHPVVPGSPICGMRMPCGGRLRRAREGIERLRAIGVSTVPRGPKGRGARPRPPCGGRIAVQTRSRLGALPLVVWPLCAVSGRPSQDTAGFDPGSLSSPQLIPRAIALVAGQDSFRPTVPRFASHPLRRRNDVRRCCMEGPGQALPYLRFA
jgi:hypothetical protein